MSSHSPNEPSSCDDVTFVKMSTKDIQLQRILMSYRMIDCAKFKAFYEYCYKKEAEVPTHFQEMFDLIKKNLSDFNYKLEMVKCEVTGKMYYCVVQKRINPHEPHFNKYSEELMRYLNAIIGGIVISSAGALSTIECVNKRENLPIKDAESALETFEKDKFIMKVDCGWTLTPIAILSLENHKEIYRDSLKTCTFCRKTIYYGPRCQACNAMGHTHCVNAFMGGYGCDIYSICCENCGKPFRLRGSEEDKTADEGKKLEEDNTSGGENNSVEKRKSEEKKSGKENNDSDEENMGGKLD